MIKMQIVIKKFPYKGKGCLSCIFNTMAADDLLFQEYSGLWRVKSVYLSEMVIIQLSLTNIRYDLT